MNKKKLWAAGLISLIALMLNFQLALAHESVIVGDYEIEYGWLNEPVIAGQLNAFVVNVSDISSGNAQPMENVSSLTVTVSYGGQSKTFTLQPLGEDTPGQFVAPILPTIPGQYTLSFGGKLEDTDVKNVEVEPEEVETDESLQFPLVSTSQYDAVPRWLIWFTLLTGLVGIGFGLGVGAMALRKG